MISFLFLLLIVLVMATMPAWPYSRTWGYYPTGLVGIVMSVLILLAISGRLLTQSTFSASPRCRPKDNVPRLQTGPALRG